MITTSPAVISAIDARLAEALFAIRSSKMRTDSLRLSVATEDAHMATLIDESRELITFLVSAGQSRAVLEESLRREMQFDLDKAFKGGS